MAAEFVLGDYILVLDGRTVEIFRRGLSESMRFHVAFFAVEVKPRGDEYKVRAGAAKGDQILGGARLSMNAEEFARFREFTDLAIAARETR